MGEHTSETTSGTPDRSVLTRLTSELVAAYLGHNRVQPSEIPDLLVAVHDALVALDRKSEPEIAIPRVPPMPIKKTVTDGHIYSLEDGKPYRSLKRHLAKHGLTPASYRSKWGLPYDYPMSAPSYTRARSELAKKMNLGGMRRKR